MLMANYYNRNMCFPDICRICLFIVKDYLHAVCIDSIQLTTEEIPLRNILYFCCPELDLRINPKAILCSTCFEIVNIINDFIYKCNKSNGKLSGCCDFTFPSTQSSRKLENCSTVLKNEIKTEEIDLPTAEGCSLLIQSLPVDIKSNIIRNYNSNFGTKQKHEVSQLDYKYIHKNISNQHMGIYPIKTSIKCLQNNLNVTYPINLQPTKEKLFKCDYSDKLDNLEDHMGVHKKKIFKCFNCNYSSIKKAKLKNHMRTHIGEKPLQYSHILQSSDMKIQLPIDTEFLQYKYCNKELTLKSHVPILTGGELLKCSQCNYSTPYLDNLKTHINTHTEEKPHKCSQCNYRALQLGTLKRHMIIHSVEKSFKCSQCNYSSVYLANLKTHMRVHTGETPFKCQQCDYSSRNLSSLKIHMFIHTGEKPFKCSQCNYSSLQLCHLKRHMCIHTGEKPFKCSQCNYSARQSKYLKSHMCKHTGEKPFKCSQCNYNGRDAYTLRIHMYIHAAEKPFKCSHCKYSTLQSYHLKRHMGIHTGEKPFKCSHCNYCASQMGNLKSHLRMHTGEKRFKCFHCSYSSSTKGSLKGHMQIHRRKSV